MNIQRRIRVTDCPYRKHTIEVNRKRKTENYTICPHCYSCMDNEQIVSRLEHRYAKN